ncbi:hypothetical protein B0H16DRAFT_1749579 [Mycena metata]|uniref:Uncharacterized protein n=1 Tax=Mycena metata TaxID=1033252 RepID=A0AAD7DTS4_9AGAR|nr:hypothetical protein B0H16DRAFT_1749579 [Mycena metata]
MEGQIHQLLINCGLDPIAVLEALGVTRSVISGSVPVAAMFPGQFEPNDVDIYTAEPEETAMLAIFRDQLNFTVVKQARIVYPKHMAISRIYWLTEGKAKVNLIIVKGGNALAAIFQFHSTLVMNAISVDGLFCAYPELTLKGMSLVNSSFIVGEEQEKRAAICIEKYESRGFAFITEYKITEVGELTDHKCRENANCPGTVRRLEDGHSLFYPLNAHKEEEDRKADATFYTEDGLNTVEWCLGGRECYGEDAWTQGFVTSMVLKEDGEH